MRACWGIAGQTQDFQQARMFSIICFEVQSGVFRAGGIVWVLILLINHTQTPKQQYT